MRKISKFLSIVALGLLVGGCSQGQKAGQGNADYSQNQQDQALHDRGQRHPDGRQEHRPFGDPPGQQVKGGQAC